MWASKFNRNVYLPVFFVAVLIISACSNDLGYDPSDNPFTRLEQATIDANNENRLILVLSGGDWCRWCHILNNYLQSDSVLYKRLKNTFVIMKVYQGDKNYNQKFFATLPASKGVPHFWILSKDGQLVGVQDTGVLENGRDSYDREKFMRFINYWENYRNKSKVLDK